MPDVQFLKMHIQRLGGSPDTYPGDSAIESLAGNVGFPDSELVGDVGLGREMLAAYGISKFDKLDDEDLEEEMPLITGFQFAPADGFFEDWAEVLPNAGPQHTPFANDDYYYYFLVENPANPDDPLIQAIDHEEPDLPPEEYYDLTAGKLLAIVKPD